MFTLEHIYGKETLDKEFKEFCLSNLNLYFTQNDISNFIFNKKKLDISIFNNMIINDINEYITKYIPKYMSSFSNSNIMGKIYIGINDNGIIEGIPFCGKLKKNIIKKNIKSVITNSRGIRNYRYYHAHDDNITKWYYDNIKVKIIKVNKLQKYNDMEENIKKLMNSEHNNLKNINIWKNYIDNYNKWHSLMTDCTCKLIEYLLNDKKKNDIIEYIKDIFKNNDNLDKTKLNSLIAFFTKNDDYYKNLNLTLEYIEEIIKDEYSPIKWLIEYKDNLIYKNRILKPHKPQVKIDKSLYYRFANNVLNIKQQLINLHKNINFYVIKITIPHMDDSYLEYRTSDNSFWMSRTRVLSHIGPICDKTL